MEKHNQYVVIYFDEDKKHRQIIHPTKAFTGDWRGLVNTVTMSGDTKEDSYNNYHSFEINYV